MYAVIRSGGKQERVAEASACASNCWRGRRDRGLLRDRPAGGRRHRPGHPDQLAKAKVTGQVVARSRGEDPCHDLQGEEQPAATLGPPPALRDGGDHLHRCGLRKGTPCRRPRVAVPPETAETRTPNGSGQDFSGTACRRVDPGTPARHALSPRHQRRRGSDDTLFALTDGVVKFGTRKGRSWSTSSRLIERRYRRHRRDVEMTHAGHCAP